MDVGVLSVRYAKALLEYAQNKGVAEDLYSQAKVLLDCFAENPSLSVTLEDPLLTRSQKLELISSALSCSQLAKEVMVNYFSLIISKHREPYIASSLRSFIGLYRKSAGITVVKMITAVPLEKDMEDKILAKVSGLLGKKVELQKSVDPSIEGGFIFDIDDYRLDASVATRIRQIRQQLLSKNKRIV